MSDIRFNNWKHQSGTGGVVQNSGGKVGIGSTQPTSMLDVGGDVKVSGVVTATAFHGSGANLTSLCLLEVLVDRNITCYQWCKLNQFKYTS